MKPIRAEMLAAVVALVLAGCGAEEQAPPPLLPQDIAADLAARSDRVAGALDAGDPCGAAEESRQLRDRAIAAVNDDEVPPELKEELLAAVQDLTGAAEDACAAVPPPTTETEPEDEGENRGKDKGKHKGKNKDGNDDTEPILTLPLTTVPTETTVGDGGGGNANGEGG